MSAKKIEEIQNFFKKRLLFEIKSGIVPLPLKRGGADVAQLVELLICNQWVRGSSPCVGTTSF